MPIGIISNALVIIFGGIVGSLLGHKMSLEFKENMNMIFGAGAMTMGISSIMLMENLSAVIFSVVVGTAIGMAIHFGQWIAKGGEMMEKGIGRFIKKKESNISEEEFRSTLITIIVLFCASGTGIYGSMVSGMTGDSTILISKSILDFFTSMILPVCSDR